MKRSKMQLRNTKKLLTLGTVSLLLAAQTGWAQGENEGNAQQESDQWSVMDNRGESRDQQPAAAGSEATELEQDMASETAAQDADSDQVGQQQGQRMGQQQDGNAQAVAAQAFQNVPVDQLQGRTVTNLQGEEVGQVEDVVVSQQGNNAALVVSTGGVMGIGGKEVVLKAEQVEVNQDQIVWQSNEDKQSLEQMPEYSEREYVSVR